MKKIIITAIAIICLGFILGDTVIDNVRFLDKSMARCMGCHQSAAMLQGSKQNEYLLKRLYDLKSDIDEYKNSLSRYLTMRANRNRTEIEFNKAFHTTEK